MRITPYIAARIATEPWLISRARGSELLSRFLAVEAATLDYPRVEGSDEDEGSGYVRVGSSAIIPVFGVIGKDIDAIDRMWGGMCDVDDAVDALDVAEVDPLVKQIVFAFNTPGGTVTGIPEAAARILEATKPTVAFTDTMCCSAGYWLASQCRTIYCTESAAVGSVGVWTAYVDYSRMLENDGVKVNAFSAGKHKLLGAPWASMTDEQKAIVQAGIDKVAKRFREAVNIMRQPMSEPLDTALVYDGEDAARMLLVDGLVDDMDDVLG
jgi:signal peptide peptidase SppA